MEFIAEVVGWILFECLLPIPGAVVRWLCFVGTRPFKVILNKERGLNIAVSFILMLVFVFVRTINL